MSVSKQNIKKIILADDDEDDCILFEDVLKELSLSVELIRAHNGQQLMQLLQKENFILPDVIFLDLNMPLKNGRECLQEIKHDGKLKNIPVIIFSTSAQPESVAELFDLGADFYIRKPGTFLRLKDILSKVLSMKLARDPARPREDFFIS